MTEVFLKFFCSKSNHKSDVWLNLRGLAKFYGKNIVQVCYVLRQYKVNYCARRAHQQYVTVQYYGGTRGAHTNIVLLKLVTSYLVRLYDY